MKKYFITGFSGFVSQHFLRHLNETHPGSHIKGIDVQLSTSDAWELANIAVEFEKVDMLDCEALEHALEVFSPDYVIHLASFSSVAYSWRHPVDCSIWQSVSRSPSFSSAM